MGRGGRVGGWGRGGVALVWTYAMKAIVAALRVCQCHPQHIAPWVKGWGVRVGFATRLTPSPVPDPRVPRIQRTEYGVHKPCVVEALEELQHDKGADLGLLDGGGTWGTRQVDNSAERELSAQRQAQPGGGEAPTTPATRTAGGCHAMPTDTAEPASEGRRHRATQQPRHPATHGDAHIGGPSPCDHRPRTCPQRSWAQSRPACALAGSGWRWRTRGHGRPQDPPGQP